MWQVPQLFPHQFPLLQPELIILLESLGKILDIYWQFAEAGDSYLGRCLCGLDPNDSTFSVLPPHWDVDNPMLNKDINTAMQMMYYGTILKKHPGSTAAVLVRLLASVTYASDLIQETAARHPGHPFSALPLLQSPNQLRRRLKTKVTIKPTTLLSNATGVPPHVKQLSLMTSLLELCQTTIVRLDQQADVVRQSIFTAMEERALENGQITRTQIVEIRNEFRDGIRSDVTQLRSDVRQQIASIGICTSSSSSQHNRYGDQEEALGNVAGQ